MVVTITRNGVAASPPRARKCRRLGGLRAGPGRSVADLRGVDEVELLGVREGVEQVANLLGVERELAEASSEGRQLEEIVAQVDDVEALESQRVGQNLDDQLVLSL